MSTYVVLVATSPANDSEKWEGEREIERAISPDFVMSTKGTFNVKRTEQTPESILASREFNRPFVQVYNSVLVSDMFNSL